MGIQDKMYFTMFLKRVRIKSGTEFTFSLFYNKCIFYNWDFFIRYQFFSFKIKNCYRNCLFKVFIKKKSPFVKRYFLSGYFNCAKKKQGYFDIFTYPKFVAFIR